MTDMQPVPSPSPSPVFPGVYGPAVATLAPAAGTLTRPSGTALHVLADPEYLLVRRSLVGTCTAEEWASPAHRRLAIAKAWEQGIGAIRAEDEEFVSFAPVILYRHPLTHEVEYADIRLPGAASPKLITRYGQPVLASADTLLGLLPERTSYARWAEGPLTHVNLDMSDAPTPDEDRDIQWLRHQNSALRELIDAALGPSEWAPQANSATATPGLCDFCMRGVFRRRQIRRFESKQGAGVSAVLIGGQAVTALDFEHAHTTEGLDAILESDEF